jgi:hypothetical protein
MRAAILDAVARAAPLSGRERLLHAPGNIVEALLAEGIEPYLILSASCAASGLPAARRAWLEGPVPTWPADFDPGLCRQLGACPVALRKGQWVVAYSDPEIAAAADSLGLPDHVRALALPQDLERFFAAAPVDANPFDTMAATDAGELFAPMSQFEPALATDKIAAPVSATADETHDGEDGEDDDDDDLDLYVDRLADQLTQQQARPTPGPPPAARRPVAPLDPPVRPAAVPRPVRPAPAAGGARAGEGRAPSRRLDPGAPAPPASTWKPAEPPEVPTTPSRTGLLVAGAVVCVVVAAIAWPRLRPPPPPPPAPTSAIVVKDGALEFSAAQEALLQKARAEQDHTVAVRLLSDAIRLDPSSTVARTALLERARRAIGQGQLTQADNDLERLRRRRDAAEVQSEIEALATLRRAAKPAPTTPTVPAPTTPTAPTPPPTPPTTPVPAPTPAATPR